LLPSRRLELIAEAVGRQRRATQEAAGTNPRIHCGGTLECRRPLSSGEPNMRSYQVKFRCNGILSITTVVASDSSQARKLVIAQFGAGTEVLSTQRV
jgi:hypothetical protein